MNTKKITYAIIPFAVVVTMLMITYFGNQWYSETFGVVGTDLSYIFLKFNQAVPFVPLTIYPYVLAYPFWAFTFFYVGSRSKKNMYTLLLLVLITFTICGLWYFFFQTDVQAWRETSGLFGRNDLNFTESIIFWIYSSAGPRNANPSMHVLMSWLCILGARLDKKMPVGMKIFIWVMSISICVATQTLKQHYIIDLITSVIIAEGFFWLVKESKAVGKLQNFFTRINQKLKIDWEE